MQLPSANRSPVAYSGLRGRLFVFSLLIALCGFPGAAVEDISPQRSWSSKKAGVQLRLLTGWTVQSEPGKLPLVLREPTGRAVMGLLIEPMDISDPTPDLEKLTDASVKSHRNSIKKFKVINRRTVQVDGDPATELFFRGKRNDVSYRWVQTFFLSRNNKVFILYSAPASLYERYVGDYDQLVRSVRKLPS